MTKTRVFSIRAERDLVEGALKKSGLSLRNLLEGAARQTLKAAHTKQCDYCSRKVIQGDVYLTKGTLCFDTTACLFSHLTRKLRLACGASVSEILPMFGSLWPTLDRAAYLVDDKGRQLQVVSVESERVLKTGARCKACGTTLHTGEDNTLIAGKGEQLYHPACLLPANTEALRELLTHSMVAWRLANSHLLTKPIALDVEEFEVHG